MSAPGKPWRRWLALGLGVMGLTPRVFWRLSLAEWHAMLEGHAMRFAGVGVPALGRAELAQLILRYPDRETT